MRVCLVTLGDPHTLTGGYLYHLRMAEEASNHGAEMSFFSVREGSASLMSARGLLGASRDADTVVVDSIAAWCAAPWLGRVRVPVAGMLHQGPGGMEGSRLVRAMRAPLDRRAYRFMRLVMVASDALAADLQTEIPGDKMIVVAPGRDVAEPSHDVGDIRHGRRAALLSVGNWVPRKGTLELLRAFEALPPDLATLHLVGRDDVDASYSKGVRSALDALGGRVVVHGPLPKGDVAALYAAADAFVLPSYVEPYGTVYGEALAFGLPVIGWNAGNLPYLATDAESGLIVPTGDVSSLTEAMRRIAEDDALRGRLAGGAERRGRELPTWDETAALFFSRLQELVRS